MKISEILIAAVLIALAAPVIAQLQSGGSDADQGVEHLVNESTMKPMDGHYNWNNSLALDLSGMNPVVFQNAQFSKDPDSMSSGNLFTPSIFKFLNSDPNAGNSSIPKKAAKVGLVHWAGPSNTSS